ncbi:MAG: stage II sporulation protein R [Clostridia bacterium]|nr:stage II sporulation protein R [Clostridia bacterium]
MEKKAFTVLLIAVSLTLIIGLLPIHGEKEIYDSVVRLHVLANSNSEEDQALKLKVRDDILVLTEALLSECTSRSEAIEVIESNLELYRETAMQTLAENGSEYEAKVTLGEEYYPTRQYESAAFPSGDYVSLQIKIGKAEGKNWWCVLFPPICLSAASGKEDTLEDAFIAAGLTPEQYRIITETKENENGGKYEIRFKILEIFKELVGMFD